MAGSELSRTDRDALQQRNRELSILNSIAQALNQSFEVDEALRVALAQVADLLGLHTGWIWLLDEDTGASYLGAALNLPSALTKNPRRMSGRCYCLDTYRKGDMAGAAKINVVRCSRLDGLVDGTDGLRYHASIPLYARGKKLGVLNLASPGWREPSAEDLRLLNTIGDLVSMAVERARLFARSTRLGAVEERSRLARELHDTLAQGLTAIALQLESADALLDSEADRKRVQAAIRKALRLTRANLEETRRSVQDLRATPLEGKTLAEALAVLAVDQNRSSATEVRFEIAGESRPLPVRIENGVYRMAQEALTNALRHANAQHILLRLETVPQRIRLRVEDDGQGFETEECDPPRSPLEHYGLVGMNERTRLLGGTLRLETGPGEGTRIEIDIPLDETASEGTDDT